MERLGLGHTSACEMDLPICFGSRSWKGNFGIDCSDDAQDPECPNWKRITAIMHYILTLGSYSHDALFVDNVLLQPSCIVCWLQLTAPCPDLGTGRGDLLSNAACVAEKAGEASFTSRMDGLSWLVALTVQPLKLKTDRHELLETTSETHITMAVRATDVICIFYWTTSGVVSFSMFWTG